MPKERLEERGRYIQKERYEQRIPDPEIRKPKNMGERQEMINVFNKSIEDLEKNIGELSSFDADPNKYMEQMKVIGEEFYRVMSELLLREEKGRMTFENEKGKKGYETKLTVERDPGDPHGKRVLLREVKDRIITEELEKREEISEEKKTKDISIDPGYFSKKDLIVVTEYARRVKDKKEKFIPGRSSELPNPDDLRVIFSDYGENFRSMYDKLVVVKTPEVYEEAA